MIGLILMVMMSRAVVFFRVCEFFGVLFEECLTRCWVCQASGIGLRVFALDDIIVLLLLHMS